MEKRIIIKTITYLVVWHRFHEYYLTAVETFVLTKGSCTAVTCTAVLAGDKNLLLGLPMSGTSADRG